MIQGIGIAIAKAVCPIQIATATVPVTILAPSTQEIPRRMTMKWTNNGGRIEAANAGTSSAEVIAIVGTINHQTPQDTATARLIAAAPELLEALETMLRDMHTGVSTSQRVSLGPDGLGCGRPCETCRTARDAIRAAKGAA